MIKPEYKAQVDLLLDVIPHVAAEENFALKGGTAINMFVWDMPRLSVDIDLTYLPFDNREDALSNIADSLHRIQEILQKAIPGMQVKTLRAGNDPEAKLICTTPNAKIKIEVNTIMRGHISPVRLMQVSTTAQNEFGKFVEMKVISDAELFGGKICAALDRQHPRDLFDIQQLFTGGGITEEIKDGFIASLLSHNKSIHEVLNPTIHDQKQAFGNQFQGMTIAPFTYADFEETRERLIKEILDILTEKDKQLLLSIKSGNPDWSLSSIEELQNLPAVKWKLQNIRKLRDQDSKGHGAMLQKLESVLLI
ncbi:nucleotidyl transferase AbiEii/AbiGii toxin family protein [Rickettsiales bacterium]|nr:nucleotidyl transferase AbiEii/AbiGii toxin family protein [Rickettsiales bacterium]